MFLHENPDFPLLIEQTANFRDILAAQVEKDYWITHTLWALHTAGLEVWFKGGTCLSKGYGIIERFSEDLDLKLETGTMAGIPPTPNWKGEKEIHVHKRKSWYRSVAAQIEIPGCRVQINPEMEDERWRSVVLDVVYPGTLLHLLGPVIRPWVRLEIGSARVTPFLERRISAWVHDFAENNGGLEGILDNRPLVRCIHPQVTLIEKLDAMMRRWEREDLKANAFARHYEDAARVTMSLSQLPRIEGSVRALTREMLEGRQIRAWPDANHPCFRLEASDRTEQLREAYAAIDGMFWGKRLLLEEACSVIQHWIIENLQP